MASSLQTLVKILRLEQSKEYQNKAVIGGFARFAYHWAREAHGQAQSQAHHDLVDEIAERLRVYETLVDSERPAMIEEIIGLASSTPEPEEQSVARVAEAHDQAPPSPSPIPDVLPKKPAPKEANDEFDEESSED